MEDLLEYQVADDILKWVIQFYSQDIFYVDQKVTEAYWKEKLDAQVTRKFT